MNSAFPQAKIVTYGKTLTYEIWRDARRGIAPARRTGHPFLMALRLGRDAPGWLTGTKHRKKGIVHVSP
jgi:hypothetical protein